MTDNKDEWTVIPAKGKRATRSPKVGQGDLLDRDATIASIRKDYALISQEWSRSSGPRQLRQLLDLLHVRDRLHITHAACIGIGSFAPLNQENKTRSLWQLAVLLEVVKYLRDLQGTTIDVYCQDPRFVEVDKNFLASLELIVVDFNSDSEKFQALGPIQDRINEHAFVADFFTEKSVTAAFADLKIGLLISALPQLLHENIVSSALDMSKLIDMLKGLTAYTLPDMREYTHALHGLYLCAPALREDEDS